MTTKKVVAKILGEGGLNQKRKVCYNKLMSASFVVKASGIIGLIGSTLMLTLTSPTEIGPLGVLVFFTTLYITIFSAIFTIWQIFNRLAFKKSIMHRRDYLCSAVLAFGPIMVILARSFGAINLWTLSLIVLFLLLAEFLVYKKT